MGNSMKRAKVIGFCALALMAFSVNPGSALAESTSDSAQLAKAKKEKKDKKKGGEEEEEELLPTVS